MAKYLDEDGLKHLWSKIEEKFIDKNELPNDAEYTMDYKDGKIYLYKDGAIVGDGIDASPFIKDGMLDDVEIVDASESNPIVYDAVTYTEGKFIKFVWNVSNDDEYPGEGNSVKYDYLKVTDIAVDPETNNTALSESITVAGGPLADLWLNAGLGNTVDTTKYPTVQSLLQALFCVEKWSSISKNSGSPKVSVATTFTLSQSDKAVVTVGTPVTVSALSAKQTNTTTSASVSGFDYEYYSLNGSEKVKGTSVSKAWTYAGEGTESASITSYVGFGLSAVPAQSDTLIAAIGTNSLTATSTGVAKTASCEQVGPVYDVSNLGNVATDASYIYTIEAQTKELAAPTSTVTRTVIGVYPVYSNANTEGENLVDASVEYVEDAKTFTIEYGAENGNFNAFLFPASHVSEGAPLFVENYNPLNAAAPWNEYAGGSSISDVELEINGVTYNYKMWKRNAGADPVGYTEATKFRFTLNKNTSVE